MAIVAAFAICVPSSAAAAHCGPGVHRVHTKHMTCNQADRQVRAYYRKANRPSLPCENGCTVRRMHCHAGVVSRQRNLKGRCARRHRYVTWQVRIEG